jgi:hypothetical protein
MKILTVLSSITTLLLCTSAHAEISQIVVNCKGLITSEAGVEQSKIEVKTSDDLSQLLIAIYPVTQKEPTEWDWRDHEVTRSIKMFPIASIEAKRDMRPADGVLTLATLAISNSVVRPGISNPSTLTLDLRGFDRRKGKEEVTKEQHKLSCSMASAPRD